MPSKVPYQCRACGDEFTVEVSLGESNDLPENCPNCNTPIPQEQATIEVEDTVIGRAEAAEEDDARS